MCGTVPLMLDVSRNIRYLFDENTEKIYHKSIAILQGSLLDYMHESLIFEHVSQPDSNGTITVDLRNNSKITYKKVGLTLYQCPEFELEHSFEFYKTMIPDYKDKVVFDCGACCGLDAILFAKSGARHVYCLEPDTKNFNNLIKNTQGYPITCIQKALFKHNDQVEFSSENTQGSMILGKSIDISVDELKKIRNCTSTTVDCVTLDRMVELYGNPDIVKIDIEGSEYDLIGSMDKLLELGPKIIFEIHQRIPKIEHYNKLEEYIKSFGYTVHGIYSNEIVGDHILCVK